MKLLSNSDEVSCKCRLHLSPKNRAKKTSHVYGKGSDKHPGGVERGAPRPLIDSEMQRTSSVRKPQACQATCTCRKECPKEHAGYPEQWKCCHCRASIARVGIRTCHRSPSDRPPALPVWTVTTAENPGRNRSR